MFASILSSYGKQMDKEWPSIRRRLDDGETLLKINCCLKEAYVIPLVRLRGRKRSMVG